MTFMDAGGHTSFVSTGFAKILAEGSNTGFTFQVPHQEAQGLYGLKSKHVFELICFIF